MNDMNRTVRTNLKTTTAAVAAALVMAFSPLARAQEAATARAGQMTITVPEAEMQKLLATYALIKQDYVGQTDDKKLFDGALSGMLASLDAHSQYLDQDGMREVERSSSGEYVGIGVEIEFDRDRMCVISAAENSPAARAGIAPGDVIVAIDGVALADLPDSEVTRHMVGEPGTVANVDVLSHGRLRSLHIRREAVHADTVHTRMAANGVAWIRISEFGGATGGDLVQALKQLDGKAPPRGLVLDLRNDPGGLVAAGVAVAGAFLPQGAVVFSSRGREPGAQATVTVDPRYYRRRDEADVLAGLPAWTRSVPLTVLVNGASASAAELVAGALQDHRRATIIGTRTFGKGSIQSIIALDEETGVKFTVARYFTPNGHEIQEHGVMPDIVVAPASADREPLRREADLEGHLPATQQDAIAAERALVEPTHTFGTREDKALHTAVALLKPKDGRGGPLMGLLRRLRGNPDQAAASLGGTGAAATAMADAR
jgi:carboxyl-terminal processing protease